jgi:hypothetical protein
MFALLFEVRIAVGTDPAKNIRAIFCTPSRTTSRPSKAPQLVFEVEKPDVALADQEVKGGTGDGYEGLMLNTFLAHYTKSFHLRPRSPYWIKLELDPAKFVVASQ